MFFITFIFGAFIVLQVIHSYRNQVSRSNESLLNQYFRLRSTNPEGAKRALEIILQKDPKNKVALLELSYWYLRKGDTSNALKQLNIAHQLYPQDDIIKHQIAELNVMIHSNLQISKQTPLNPSIRTVLQHNEFAKLKYCPRNEYQPNPTKASAPAKTAENKKMSERDIMLQAFYDNKKKKNSHKAWLAMNKLLCHYPNDLVALKEAGYYSLSEEKKELSVFYFERAYAVSHDPMIALQLGYILDGLNKKRLAYQYFDLATQTPDLKERLKAEISKTNLRGVQTQFLPEPYFANLLFYPFYQSRFKLLIYPLIARAGIMLNKTYDLSIYASYRRTSDDKSNGSGVLPQIYEDDAAISSLGIQIKPVPKIPILAFMEAGKAVDLVYKNRGRWRNDFRIGLLLYDDWGKEARYSFTPHFTFKPNIDVYGDLVYYSRYLNTIGTLRLRPGVEVFRYGSTSVNFYYKIFLGEDHSRLFFNNILETGPSIAFTPNERYNVTIRYESLHGYYLPASNPAQRNPYSHTYHNNMLFLDTYVGF